QRADAGENSQEHSAGYEDENTTQNQKSRKSKAGDQDAESEQHHKDEQTHMLMFAEGRHGQGAADGSDSRANKENDQCVRAAVKDILSENGQKDQQRKCQQGHHEGQHDQGLHGSQTADEMEAFFHTKKHGFAALGRHEMRMNDE